MSDLLRQLTDTVSAWDAARARDREACTGALTQLADNIDAAIALWRECEERTEPVDNRYTVVVAIGADRAKALHGLHLDQRAAAAAATGASGVALKDSLGIAEAIDVVQAYGQFEPGETIADHAAKAIETLEKRRDSLREALARL